MDIFEENGEEIIERKILKVESHDSKKGLVILKYANIVIAIPAQDLKAAVTNVTRMEQEV